METRYDIFSGTRENDPLWLETVAGLDEAVSRMEQRAKKNPGDYFVFDAQHQAVVAFISFKVKQRA